MDRDRRLCELMGLCWHEPEWHILKTCRDGRYGTPCAKCGNSVEPTEPYHPDFSLPEWRARLKDFVIDDSQHPDWKWEEFWWWAYENTMNVKDAELLCDFDAYLWRNLPSLLVEYHKDGYRE